MAKTDSFFIRADLKLADDDTFKSTSIDLGAYVDALGKSVLLIRNVSASITGHDGKAPTMDADSAGACMWQLTTQAQTDVVPASNRSVISAGQIWARNPDAAANPPVQVYESDMLPQHFTNGYLVAVESLELGGLATNEWANTDAPLVSIVMECQVTSLTSSAAMALALSQQGN